MRDSAGKEDVIQIGEELSKLAKDMRAAFIKCSPVFLVALEQMHMAAQNAKVGLKAFGEEVKKALENWANEDLCPGCGNPLSEGGHGNCGEFGGCV